MPWSYDADGRATSETSASGSLAYSWDANGQQLAAGASSFSHDLAGRLVSAAGSTFAYDPLGRLLSSTAAGVSTSYGWDATFGIPMLATTSRAGTVTTLVHALGPVGMRVGSAAHFFEQGDGVGSVETVTSAAGVPEWTYGYEPFGGERAATQQQPGAPSSPLRFAGELFNDDTGLYHLRARDYDPALGRFLTRDPLPPTFAAPLETAYAYVSNRPLVLVDPPGLRGEEPCAGALEWDCLSGWMGDRKRRLIDNGSVSATGCYLVCIEFQFDRRGGCVRGGFGFYGLGGGVMVSDAPASCEPAVEVNACYGVCVGRSWDEYGRDPHWSVGLGTPSGWVGSSNGLPNGGRRW